MKLKKRKLVVILVIAAIIIAAAGIFAYNLFNRKVSSPVLNNASRNEKWTADLKFVKSELPKKHKNLFFSKSKVEFDRDMDSLISKVDKYNDMQIKWELTKIISSINDSHTSVVMQSKSAYPVNFFQFEDGIYLVNSSLAYKDFLGKKLVAVNGYSIEQLHLKLDPIISKDNKAILKNQFCSLLRFPGVLKFAGIAKNDDTVFTFEGSPNTSVTVKSLNKEEFDKTKFLSDDSKYINNIPLSKKNSDKNYWFKYIEKSSTIYVKYNSCSNMKNYSFSSFTKDVFKTLDSKKAKTLVIDLRDNGGGNSKMFDSFLDEIKKRSNINKKGNLYVIIGRKTFSSAILNTMDLKNSTNALLIGEPTGGKPNHFGEVKVIHLSNTNVDIQYSSKYFKTTSKDTDSIYPDVNITLKASSYFNGKDDFLNYILDRQGIK
ncbi:S41 family peptidase [Clostridium coskatii]|uniref:Peptidase family S41 n=1 Tax=Clostridium coskatii TaxID=1705578 RepID=A0A166SWP1_9CLOT|nr:S41 family peptidase [Clostridium coskatii]OAA92873.1 Peptidase family S41 [Clostridium coskatii]OBR95815.1 peptidase family S41 [Clostridium coskatii]